ncbi:hypothetical protein IC582_025444 [Cucumis melo]
MTLVLRSIKKCMFVVYVSTSLMLFSMLADFLVVLSSPGQLALELSCDTLRSWPTDGQLPTVKLSVKDAILQKNWHF